MRAVVKGNTLIPVCLETVRHTIFAVQLVVSFMKAIGVLSALKVTNIFSRYGVNQQIRFFPIFLKKDQCGIYHTTTLHQKLHVCEGIQSI